LVVSDTGHHVPDQRMARRGKALEP